MAKKNYTYEIESVNFANGKRKDTFAYDSPARLKIGNIYFSLPGLPIGGYKVVKEIEREEADEK